VGSGVFEGRGVAVGGTVVGEFVGEAAKFSSAGPYSDPAVSKKVSP